MKTMFRRTCTSSITSHHDSPIADCVAKGDTDSFTMTYLLRVAPFCPRCSCARAWPFPQPASTCRTSARSSRTPATTVSLYVNGCGTMVGSWVSDSIPPVLLRYPFLYMSHVPCPSLSLSSLSISLFQFLSIYVCPTPPDPHLHNHTPTRAQPIAAMTLFS